MPSCVSHSERTDRDLDRFNLFHVKNSIHRLYKSVVILEQFTLKMCVAVRNHQKNP